MLKLFIPFSVLPPSRDPVCLSGWIYVHILCQDLSLELMLNHQSTRSLCGGVGTRQHRQRPVDAMHLMVAAFFWIIKCLLQLISVSHMYIFNKKLRHMSLNSLSFVLHIDLKPLNKTTQ